MAVYKRDIVDINLETGNIHRSFLKHSIGYKDQQADHFGIRAYRNGEPVNLTGVSIQGIFMPPQGSPIAITSGNIVNYNEAEVVLPQACYNYDGQFTLAIKLVDPSNSVTGTMRIVDGMVDNTHASGTVAPVAAIPSYQEVLSTYEQAIAAINKTVRFDATQSLTDTQKATARSNISAPSVAEMNTAVGNEATARQNADALKVNISDIENDLTGTAAGKVLDARQGKVLDDKITAEAATRAAADSDLKSALSFDEYLINVGEYTITKDDLESGQWSYSTKAASTTRVRTKNLLPVRAGMTIKYKNTTFDTYFGVLETPTSNSYVQTPGWKTDGEGIVSITKDGWLTFIIRNHSNTSATVNPADYNSTVTITTVICEEVTDIKTMMSNNGIVILKHAGLSGNPLTPYNTQTRVLIDFQNYGKMLKCKVKQGYQCVVYNRETLDAYISIATPTDDAVFFINAYIGTEWAFVIRKTDNSATISFEEAYNNFTIKEVNHQVEDVSNGLYRETVEFALNQTFDASELKYTTWADRAVSAPIKIPKGGMRITYNPVKSNAGTIPNFRVYCVKMTTNGFVMCTSNADLVAENGSDVATDEPVYIPYIEDAYIIIRTGAYADVSYLADSVWVYTGECRTKGKLLGLHPMRCYLDEDTGTLKINWGNQNAIINTTNYLGGYLWLGYIRKITVDPKYTIVANIYERTGTGANDYTLKDSIYTNEFGNTAGRVAGVQEIDLTKYDFEGYVHFAIQCSVMYRARGVALYSYKTPIGMGVMSRYVDVFNSVHVDYENAYQETVEQGMPSILFENINDFVDYTYPLRKESYYVLPYQKATEANRHRFTETEDASPAFYAGYNGNTVLLNVTGKSYYTAMANPNSRCYQFAWDEDSYGSIGYGITCTDFACILLGMKENYFTTQFAYGTNPKFDLIKSEWNYLTDMDLLKPGDVLTKNEIKSHTSRDGHCMICYEKRYVNSQLESVTLIEAGYPYTRFTTLYNDKYYPLCGSWNSFRRLGEYQWVNRAKPEEIKRLRDAYDLSTSYTPGTLMCDRGTDSVYGVNPVDGAHPEGSWALASRKLIVTITDDEARAIRIYKDGSQEPIRTVNIGNDTMNDLRILDIKQYITDGGLYTLKTNNSDDVQERFWVQEPFDFVETGDTSAPEGYRRIHIPNKSKLRYMEINYKSSSVESGETVYMEGWRLTYAGSQFAEDTSAYAQDETWGVLDVPESMDIPTTEYTPEGKAHYDFALLIYDAYEDGVDYGTYQLKHDISGYPIAYSGYGTDG